MPIPPHVKWDKWRVIGAGMASLQEANEYFDKIDILDANEYLDIVEEAERKAYEQASKERNK